ncbi:sialate O-acetylesterase [Blastopirellula sp. JC732]|uniref:Sialate O-acetylesterase n=1 Tax=Blastopirellula sediminis TaxID=2894196 RepID=A0A9X1SIF9_9BACT|nr:sialate O-acetylesterase [Blastopirellula sediminis]MCC9605142.1 sialate O-acetylesterase [Blastopirellula sediminis]MCC9631558.1 sialate O-acetylesterase [Blastopirellula sediminis]
MKLRFRQIAAAALGLSALFAAGRLQAEVKVPALFTDHMVLQRDLPIVVWGKAAKGEEVTVSVASLEGKTTADDDGHWSVKLGELPAGGPHRLVIKGQNEIAIEDVLVGEVWVCSGQSNMQWPLSRANDHELEAMTAKLPQLRLITVPNVAAQAPKDDFNGKWEVCTPETVREFSAVGYFFGRQLQQTLDVPVGLIDNAWGGSAAEAWVRRDLLEADPRYADMLKGWDARVVDYEAKLAEYKTAAAAAKGTDKKPEPPKDPGVNGNHRPANLYNGCLAPVIGYGIRGAIWYQGESNSGRPEEYGHLFPLMIQNWRDVWKQGDFPFYWVQLADFMGEKPEPAESNWAALRESQTFTMDKLPNTGEAVIIDIGEGRDIHPRNKQAVGMRLARIALARDYGIDVPYRSPRFKSLEVKGDKAIVTFDTFGTPLYSFDAPQPKGFAIAGADGKYVWAEAKLVGDDKVEVSSKEVKEPVSVRYAWADNPVNTLQNKAGLPATPFRSDKPAE